MNISASSFVHKFNFNESIYSIIIVWHMILRSMLVFIFCIRIIKLPCILNCPI